MSERPILFSGPMVRAILDGTKTQTRRIVSPQPERAPMFCHYVASGWAESDAPNEYGAVGCTCRAIRNPYGHRGDVLWVRESVSFLERNPRGLDLDSVWYWADGQPGAGDWTRPKPSIFMPRWASRISLRVLDVRAQRLQEISESDCCAEGVGNSITRDCKKPRLAALWDTINAKRAPWASNPWVWAITFERVNASVAKLAEVQRGV